MSDYNEYFLEHPVDAEALVVAFGKIRQRYNDYFRRKLVAVTAERVDGDLTLGNFTLSRLHGFKDNIVPPKFTSTDTVETIDSGYIQGILAILDHVSKCSAGIIIKNPPDGLTEDLQAMPQPDGWPAGMIQWSQQDLPFRLSHHLHALLNDIPFDDLDRPFSEPSEN